VEVNILNFDQAKFHAERNVLIFVHIPKTAGTTLGRILERQFPRDQIYTFDHNEQRQIDRLKILSTEEKDQIRCVKGHVPFGLHEWFSQTPRYVTVLRHPIERAVSGYYFSQSIGNENPFLGAYIKKSLREYMDFLSERNEVNLQTRIVSGNIDLDHVHPPYPPLPEEALAVAKQNLAQKFEVAGLTERFDECLILIQQLFGFRNIFYSKLNVTRTRASINQISEQVLEFIARAEHADMQLFRFAEQLFEQRIQSQGPLFKYKIHIFKLLNRFYGPALKTYHKVSRLRI
jgi:hypothetical protein